MSLCSACLDHSVAEGDKDHEDGEKELDTRQHLDNDEKKETFEASKVQGFEEMSPDNYDGMTKS